MSHDGVVKPITEEQIAAAQGVKHISGIKFGGVSETSVSFTTAARGKQAWCQFEAAHEGGKILRYTARTNIDPALDHRFEAAAGGPDGSINRAIFLLQDILEVNGCDRKDHLLRALMLLVAELEHTDRKVTP